MDLIAFVIFAVLLGLDLLAARNGLRLYYRAGLPVLYARRPLPHGAQPLPRAALKALAMRFHSRPDSPSVEFLDLCAPPPALQAGLRERPFENRSGLRFLPVMRGMARHDPSAGAVTVVGYLNLWAVFTLVYLVYRAGVEPSYIPVAILVLFLLIVSYYLQARIYLQVADTLRSLPTLENSPHGY